MNLPHPLLRRMIAAAEPRGLLLGLLVGALSWGPPALAQDGAPDVTFGDDGFVFYGDAAASETAVDIAVQPDGRIVAVGNALTDDGHRSLALRFLADGTPDPSFGDGGVASLDLDASGPGDFEILRSVLLRPDGRIVAVGTARGDFVAVALLANGTPDPDFGVFGTTYVDLDDNDEAWEVVADADGFVIAGATVEDPVPPDTTSRLDLALLRLSSDGLLDLGYGLGGTVRLNGGSSEERFFSAVPTSGGGGVIAVGYSFRPETDQDVLVVRFTPDGDLDASFGVGGATFLDVDEAEDFALGAAAAPGGGLFAVGVGGPNALAAKLTADGAPDAAFSGDGLAPIPFGPGTNGTASDAAVDGLGRLVVAGFLQEPFPPSALLARLLPDGTFDPDFGTTGRALVPVPDDGGFTYGLALQPDGNVVIAGGAFESGSTGQFDAFVARIVANTPVAAEDGPGSASGLALSAGPNPADGAAEVRFALPEPGAARVAAYDVLGREVAVLAEGPHAAGTHTVRWDPAALPDGLYLLRLTAGGHATTYRLTLAR